VNGFVARADTRLKVLSEAAGEIIARISPIGGFANPVRVSRAD